MEEHQEIVHPLGRASLEPYNFTSAKVVISAKPSQTELGERDGQRAPYCSVIRDD